MKFAFIGKSVRETDPLAPQVTAQAINILFKTLPGMQISVLLMMFIMVWVMWGSIDHLKLIIWGVFVFSTATSEILLGKLYFNHARTHAEAKRWGHYYSLISIASGLTWGSACVLFFVSDSSVLQVFLFTSIVGIATASVIQHSYWLESYYAFTVPLLTLSGLRLYLEGDITYKGLALLTLILLAIVIKMAHESHKSVYNGASCKSPRQI